MAYPFSGTRQLLGMVVINYMGLSKIEITWCQGNGCKTQGTIITIIYGEKCVWKEKMKRLASGNDGVLRGFVSSFLVCKICGTRLSFLLLWNYKLWGEYLVYREKGAVDQLEVDLGRADLQKKGLCLRGQRMSQSPKKQPARWTGLQRTRCRSPCMWPWRRAQGYPMPNGGVGVWGCGGDVCACVTSHRPSHQNTALGQGSFFLCPSLFSQQCDTH